MPKAERTPTLADLKKWHREVRDGYPENVNMRVHRALSWAMRAEKLVEDNDTRFVLLWIAFNAAYADGQKVAQGKMGERKVFRQFFAKLERLDGENLIYNAVWDRFSGSIRMMMDSEFVYSPFWKNVHGVAGNKDWKSKFGRANWSFKRAFASRDTASVLSHVFDRLYVLRNQLIHGGATWNSKVNREQVRCGADILAALVPAFVKIIIENPDKNWGSTFYPRVD